ncbi:MAG TPA: hypothetical protein VGB38_05650 [bacterium]
MISAVFLSCSKTPAHRLTHSEQRLAAAYTGLLRLGQRIPSETPAYQDSAACLLKAMHYTKEEFDRAVASLNQHPERWEAFYKAVQNQTAANKSSEAIHR